MAQKNHTTARRSLQGVMAISAIFGLALVSVETWLNADFIAQGGSWVQPAVIGTIFVTAAGAAALPIAERIWKSGQWLKGLALILVFFPLVVSLSFSASIERSGSRLDAKVAGHQSTEEQKRLANEALADAQKVRDAECAKRGSRCRAAEKAVAEARKGLSSSVSDAAQALEDSMVKRLAAMLSFLGVSEKGIEMYQPLLFPFALLVGGFLFIAVGFAPLHEPRQPVEEEAEAAPVLATLLPKDEAFERLVALLRSPWARVNKATGRRCAAELGIAESTFAKYAGDWIAAGWISRAENGALTLPSRRRSA